MVDLLQLLVAGVSLGCVYALVALGFVLIYKATETVNFAQGDLMMLGAFCALTAGTVFGFPYWAVIVFAVAVMAAVGMATWLLCQGVAALALAALVVQGAQVGQRDGVARRARARDTSRAARS